MAQSLVKLTLESNQYERGIRQAQKTWNDFTRGLGISIGKFTAVGAAIGAVTGALKVAKDAFFKNEQQLDEWNRTVEASKSVYSGFLNALNTGDISGFLTRINDITEAARAAYDALDELSTFNAFNQIQTQKARTGFTEAMAGFRMGEGTKEDVQQAAKAYQEELRTRQEKEQEAYMQAIRKVAAERGVSWGGLEQALTGKYGDYETLKNTMPSGKQIKFLPGGQFGGTNAVEVPMAVTIQEKMGEALRSLNDTELKELQALGAQAYRTGEEIAQIDKQMARILNGRKGSTSGGSGGGINNNILDKIAFNTNKANLAGAKGVDNMPSIKAMLDEGQLRESSKAWENYKDTVAGSIDAIGDSMSNLTRWTEDFDPVREKLEQQNKLLQEQQARYNLAGQAASNFGAALAGLDDPAAKAAGTVIQAISSIALGFAMASSNANTAGTGWGWLAWLAAGTAAMATTISTIHSLTGYAEGGIVKGNHYSGDMMDGGSFGINAGELVLNKAQQANLANTLQGGGMGTLHVVGKISGTDILLSADRSLRLQGKELAVWGRG